MITTFSFAFIAHSQVGKPVPGERFPQSKNCAPIVEEPEEASVNRTVVIEGDENEENVPPPPPPTTSSHTKETPLKTVNQTWFPPPPNPSHSRVNGATITKRATASVGATVVKGPCLERLEF